MTNPANPIEAVSETVKDELDTETESLLWDFRCAATVASRGRSMTNPTSPASPLTEGETK